MNLYEGQIYKDDRIFILDLTQAKKGNNSVWAIITRRNIDGFPPTRTDEFETKEKAIEYIKQIEPTTPRISLNGKSPKVPLSYENYCNKLMKQGIPSAMEIYDLNINTKREIIIESINSQDIDT
jgi:hypothetical protein